LYKKSVTILATKGQTTNLLYNALVKQFDVKNVIIENNISKKLIIQNRIKKIGVTKVIGQLLFMATIPKLLKLTSKKRIRQIITEANQDDSPIPNSKITRVQSINKMSIANLINANNPDLIIVNGTRIISQHIIEAVNAKMINIHVGITPKYRGVHGGYWAIANNDKNLFGTTLHIIDKGVDTGEVIDQVVLKIKKSDNFSTYPILQYCLGLSLIEKNINNLVANKIITKAPLTYDSNMYYQPTLFEYFTLKE